MGPNYHQCKEARKAAMCHNTVDCTPGTSCGKITKETQGQVGSLCYKDKDLHHTFRGSRISSMDKVVNQNISLSFDPLTLVCTTCKEAHSIIPSDGSGMITVITDQNFVSALSGTSECVPVIRVEDSTLEELFQFALEIFSRTPIPAGSLFLLGSTSHLVSIGSTLYALEWQNTLSKFTNRWPNAQVGPVPPVIREDTALSTLVSLVEIRYWYSKVYTNNTVYPKDAWEVVIRTLSSALPVDQNSDTHSKDMHTTALPVSLHSCTLYPQKFALSSQPRSVTAFTVEATDELVLALVSSLKIKFSCKANPEDILVREPAEREGKKVTPITPRKIIVIGASHAKRLANSLRAAGYEVTDLSIPGWVPSNTNVAALLDKVTQLGDTSDTATVCDLLSNVSFRYEDEDGNTSVPYKVHGHYHMAGKVTTASQETLQTSLKKVLPVLRKLKGLKVILPPLPRYLRTPCCADPDHCVGIGESDHATELLSKTLDIKKKVRKFDIEQGMQNGWVPDIVRCMWPEVTTTQVLTDCVLEVTGEDGVHLKEAGYEKMSSAIDTIIQERSLAALNVSDPSARRKSFYWRGFESPVGSDREKPCTSSYKSSHPGGGKWKRDHPYRSGGGGRGGHRHGSRQGR